MSHNPDFRDLFREFCDAKVEFLVVGAHAVIYYAEPRYTKDLDVWVNPTPDNAQRVWRALTSFGAPLQGVTPSDFTNPTVVYQIGLAPTRIDVIMGLGGLAFDEAWRGRTESSYAGVPIQILGKRDLITAKRRAGRPQDLADLARLECTDE